MSVNLNTGDMENYGLDWQVQSKGLGLLFRYWWVLVIGVVAIAVFLAWRRK